MNTLKCPCLTFNFFDAFVAKYLAIATNVLMFVSCASACVELQKIEKYRVASFTPLGSRGFQTVSNAGIRNGCRAYNADILL